MEIKMKYILIALLLSPLANAGAICSDPRTGATIITQGVCPAPMTFIGFAP